MSTFGRFVAAAWSLTLGATMLLGSFHLSTATSVLQIAMSGVCLVLFIAIAHDYMKWKTGEADDHSGN